MALPNTVDSTQELLDAQSHVWNLTFSFINSMCLKSALQLSIPDAIHKHNKPITLSELADALSITKSKSHGLFRLMRVLVHSKIFDKVKTDEEEAQALTRTSRLLLRDEPLSFAPFALTTTDPVAVDTYHCMTEWFRAECPTPFVTKYGRNVWEFGVDDGKWNQLFNKGMTSDSELVGSILVRECKHVFEGLETVVDVAGGSGALAKAVAAAFPGLKCVVLDLPQVVDGLHGSENMSFVSGDMFKFVPPADAVTLKGPIYKPEKIVKARLGPPKIHCYSWKTIPQNWWYSTLFHLETHRCPRPTSTFLSLTMTPHLPPLMSFGPPSLSGTPTVDEFSLPAAAQARLWVLSQPPSGAYRRNSRGLVDNLWHAGSLVPPPVHTEPLFC